MIGIAFLPPKIPTLLRNIMIQIAFGAFIYFALGEAMFNVPDGMKMSGFFGGYMMVADGVPLFNKLSLGVIGTVIGIIFSVLVGIVRFIISRKKASKSDD